MKREKTMKNDEKWWKIEKQHWSLWKIEEKTMKNDEQ